jgi:predicted nucleotidyltransferase
MLVGASCRDILHLSLGHTFATAATQDLDVALALSSWDAFHSIAAKFPSVGDTGIRFRIAGVDVDLLPFGAIEDPQGTVEPPSRREAMSVWAFEEIFASSLPLQLSPTIAIRLPTVAGFAAAKLGAWLDRSAWLETKDASDLALILYWCVESTYAGDRLYDTSEGNDVLIAEDSDLPLAAAHLLGREASGSARAPCHRRTPRRRAAHGRELPRDARSGGRGVPADHRLHTAPQLRQLRSARARSTSPPNLGRGVERRSDVVRARADAAPFRPRAATGPLPPYGPHWEHHPARGGAPGRATSAQRL